MEVQRARGTCSESQSSGVKLGFERDFARLMPISSPSTHGLPEKVCKMKTHHQRDGYSLLLKLWCLDQEHQAHLGVCRKCRITGPARNQLDLVFQQPSPNDWCAQ